MTRDDVHPTSGADATPGSGQIADPRHEPGYRLQLIGRFALVEASGEQVRIHSRRARALLGYLYLQPHRAESRSRLAGLLWSDRAEVQARASLRQCLTELRSALAMQGRTCLTIGREDVGLVRSAFSSDLEDLLEALAAGLTDRLTTLLQTTAGPLLDDLELPGLFCDWLLPYREQFERRLADGVHDLMRREQDAGDWPGVRALADAYLRRNPLDEVAAVSAIRAEASLGDASAARRRYENLTATLDRTFGVEPGADARAALTTAAVAQTRTAAGKASLTQTEPSAAADVGAGAWPPLVVVATLETGHLTGEDVFLGAAIRDEVMAGLSAFRDLRVTPASSGLAELGELGELGRNASYLLGGSVRRAPRGFTLTYQLIRSRDRQVIWSERMEAADASVSNTVEHIITKVVGAVSPTIDADLDRHVNRRSNDLYHRYVAARSLAGNAEEHALARRAAEELEALIAQDPEFYLAYLPLARLYNTDFGYTRARSSGPAERERAFTLAKAALALDRGHVYAYTVVGWCHLRRHKWEAARGHFEQAMRLNPFSADRLMDVGFGYLCLGDADRAEALFDRGLALSPKPKDSYCTDLAMLAMVRGDHARAADHLDLIARPTIWDLLYRAVNQIMAGQPDRALNSAACGRIQAIWPAGKAMTADPLRAWIGDHHPLADQRFAARFMEAACQALA